MEMLLFSSKTGIISPTFQNAEDKDIKNRSNVKLFCIREKVISYFERTQNTRKVKAYLKKRYSTNL
jgi:hypothetical protein